MSRLALVLGAGGWLAGTPVAFASLDFVSQERFVEASASAEDLSQSAEDSDARAAADFGPFLETVSAFATLSGVSATSSAFQDSELFTSSMAATGSSSAAAQSAISDGFALGEGDSRFEVTFDLAGAFSFTANGELTAALSGFALVRLTGPPGTVFLTSAFEQTTPLAESGTLVPGTYTLLVRASAAAFGDIFASDSAFASYDVEFSVEPASAGPEGARTDALFLQVSPNPFREVARVAFGAPGSVPLALSIFDVQGRRLRDLALGNVRSGALEWNALDARGRRVPPGTYFLRLESGGSVRRAKVVLVR